MDYKHLLPLAALSLYMSVGLYAGDAVSEEELTEKTDSVEINQRPSIIHIQKEAKTAPPTTEQGIKKVKPHFAGAKRSSDIKKVSNPHKPKRDKNQWYSSKTQPKIEKRPTTYQEISKLPEDHPHFVKTEGLIVQSTPLKASTPSGPLYPKTGFEAPRGHVFLTGEWLYWRLRESGTEFVTNRAVDFNYSSGFRVGIGVHLPYTDGWDISGNYTYYAPDASRYVEGRFYPLFLYQGAGSTGPEVNAAYGKWALNFQTMDLCFGRAFYLAKSLSVHPFIGMKGAWIDQKAHFDYQGGYIPVGKTFNTRFINDFKGAGPLFGLDSHWHWGWGFSLLGTLASSLVIGHFDNQQTQDQLVDHVISSHRGFNLVSPLVQMAVALAWDRNFNYERSHIGFNVGFDSQYWWNQNQTELFTGAQVPSYQRQSGDLSVYGLTLKGRLDF